MHRQAAWVLLIMKYITCHGCRDTAVSVCDRIIMGLLGGPWMVGMEMQIGWILIRLPGESSLWFPGGADGRPASVLLLGE